MALAMTDGEIHQIAVGCMYILLRRGMIDFPGSSVAHPSLKVVVSRASGEALRGGDDVYLPFSVAWDVWEFAVVPVLKDPAYQVFHPDGTRNHVNLALIQLRDYDQYLNILTHALKDKMQLEGFIPPDDDEVVVPESDLEGDGDPIVRVGSTNDSGYPLVDAGAGDITYPVVED